MLKSEFHIIFIMKYYSFSTIKNTETLLSSQAVREQLAGSAAAYGLVHQPLLLRVPTLECATSFSQLRTFDYVAPCVWIIFPAYSLHEGPDPGQWC